MIVFNTEALHLKECKESHKAKVVMRLGKGEMMSLYYDLKKMSKSWTQCFSLMGNFTELFSSFVSHSYVDMIKF